eukprot:607561-Prorocentrum_minimum.AAC.2
MLCWNIPPPLARLVAPLEYSPSPHVTGCPAGIFPLPLRDWLPRWNIPPPLARLVAPGRHGNATKGARIEFFRDK